MSLIQHPVAKHPRGQLAAQYPPFERCSESNVVQIAKPWEFRQVVWAASEGLPMRS